MCQDFSKNLFKYKRKDQNLLLNLTDKFEGSYHYTNCKTVACLHQHAAVLSGVKNVAASLQTLF